EELVACRGAVVALLPEVLEERQNLLVHGDDHAAVGPVLVEDEVHLHLDAAGQRGDEQCSNRQCAGQAPFQGVRSHHGDTQWQTRATTRYPGVRWATL